MRGLNVNAATRYAHGTSLAERRCLPLTTYAIVGAARLRVSADDSVLQLARPLGFVAGYTESKVGPPCQHGDSISGLLVRRAGQPAGRSD